MKKKTRTRKQPLDRLWFEILHAIAGIPATQISAKAAKRARGDKRYMVSPSTIANWRRKGKETYPSLRTAVNALQACNVSLTDVAARAGMPLEHDLQPVRVPSMPGPMPIGLNVVAALPKPPKPRKAGVRGHG